MLNSAAGSAIVVVSLLIFAWIGINGAKRFNVIDKDGYLTARSTQSAGGLALSYFASALGAWILFAPPEVGTFGGLAGISGYAFGQAIAVGIFAWIGPAVRRMVQDGTTILDFVRLRFNRPAEVYVAIVTVAYMFVFMIAEFTAIGSAIDLLAGTGKIFPIAGVAVATAAYTSYGGLPASIATDRWQALLTMALVAVGAVSILVTISSPVQQAVEGGLFEVTSSGLELALVLVVAIVAANLFHQGFWQRVWSGVDDRTVRVGTIGGGLLILPLIMILGITGMIAAGAGRVGIPALAFFDLLSDVPLVIVGVVVALAVTLVASTVDTLQNALTSLVATRLATKSSGLTGARLITAGLTIPAAIVALSVSSVLRVFLVADLLAATVMVPVLMGLSKRTSRASAFVGSIAGLLGIVGVGWVQGTSFFDGLRLITLPEGATAPPFLAALIASSIGSLLWTSVTSSRASSATIH